MRERPAAKWSRETSQEKEHRLKARRERAALKRQSESPPEGVETNRRAQSRRDSDTRRRNQREAVFAARRNECLHNRGWAENHVLHHEEWAQEEMAAFHRLEKNLRHYHCVVCTEAWPLSHTVQSAPQSQQIFTCSRCKRDRKPCRLFPLVRGEIFGTRVLAWRGALSSRGVCLCHGLVTSSGWRGTGAEHGGGERWALAEFFCATEYWRNRDGEGLVRSTVAGSAELSRSLFMSQSSDVIGMERAWCGARWRGALSSRGVCLCHRVVTSSGWRGPGAEHGGGERWALAEFVCVTE